MLRVNIPRNDFKMWMVSPHPHHWGSVDGCFTKGAGDIDVMMGDLVLTEREVDRVMSALLDAGLAVTAVHNHFFFETPRIFYMHVHGHGRASNIAAKLRPAVARIGAREPAGGVAAPGTPLEGQLDTPSLAKIIGTPGESSGAVYKITIGRPDIKMFEMGATINSRMGLNTWAAFYGTKCGCRGRR